MDLVRTIKLSHSDIYAIFRVGKHLSTCFLLILAWYKEMLSLFVFNVVLNTPLRNFMQIYLE